MKEIRAVLMKKGQDGKEYILIAKNKNYSNYSFVTIRMDVFGKSPSPQDMGYAMKSWGMRDDQIIQCKYGDVLLRDYDNEEGVDIELMKMFVQPGFDTSIFAEKFGKAGFVLLFQLIEFMEKLGPRSRRWVRAMLGIRDPEFIQEIKRKRRAIPQEPKVFPKKRR